jgi:hypothetical protein
MRDSVYHLGVGAALKLSSKAQGDAALSDEMLQFVDHLAELLAEEFAAALKEQRDASSGVREVLEREPEATEHRRSGPGL